MSFGVSCACGRVLAVSAGDAGAEVRCRCGFAVEVPDLRALQAAHTRAALAPSQREAPAAPTPRFVWVFVAACCRIPVLVVLGMVPLLLGVTGKEESRAKPAPPFSRATATVERFGPVAIIGVVTPLMFGAAGVAGCLWTARNESRSVGARVALSAIITAACWAVSLAVHGDLALTLLQQVPRSQPQPQPKPPQRRSTVLSLVAAGGSPVLRPAPHPSC